MAKKILIAEDERAIAGALENKLNNSGFEAKTVVDGEEALKALETEKFDLLLLDIMMPKVDGFGVLKGMKEKSIRTPVIVLSNLGQEEEIQKAKDAGAADFLVKANTPIMDIVTKINNFLK